MTETLQREITVTGKLLRGLSRSEEVTDWALMHFDRVEFMVEGYGELITEFNRIPQYHHVVETMPATKRLKEIMRGNPLPSLDEMSAGNFLPALLDARWRMLRGQDIKIGMLEAPSTHELKEAILTPSTDAAPGAIVAGTIGHIVERTFFQWATKKGLSPRKGWEKDYLLGALKESAMWRYITGSTNPYLTRYFFESSEEGGLGWVSQAELTKFREKLNRALLI